MHYMSQANLHLVYNKLKPEYDQPREEAQLHKKREKVAAKVTFLSVDQFNEASVLSPLIIGQVAFRSC